MHYCFNKLEGSHVNVSGKQARIGGSEPELAMNTQLEMLSALCNIGLGCPQRRSSGVVVQIKFVEVCRGNIHAETTRDFSSRFKLFQLLEKNYYFNNNFA